MCPLHLPCFYSWALFLLGRIFGWQLSVSVFLFCVFFNIFYMLFYTLGLHYFCYIDIHTFYFFYLYFLIFVDLLECIDYVFIQIWGILVIICLIYFSASSFFIPYRTIITCTLIYLPHVDSQISKFVHFSLLIFLLFFNCIISHDLPSSSLIF